MTAISMGRVGVPYLAMAAACGAAVAFGIIQMRHQGAPEAKTAPATMPAPASKPADQVSQALAAVQAEATAVAPPPSPAPAAEEAGPAFDVARIETSGEAVIAGRAAPGATVELMREGETLDRAVADSSGQFVMIPPRLPAGNYALTLRSGDAGGRETRSMHSVAVALAGPPPASGAVQAQSVLPTRTANAAPSTMTLPAAAAPATGSSSTAQPPQPVLQLATPEKAAATSMAAVPPDAVALPAAVSPRKSTAIVARGDSLWRISRMTYGEGTHYSLVYRANRDRIRNPDRIYPGQVFVLPLREH
jgi:nucleoid-associated protein YgaU